MIFPVVIKLLKLLTKEHNVPHDKKCVPQQLGIKMGATIAALNLTNVEWVRVDANHTKTAKLSLDVIKA